jgi:hypothetical protein
MWRRLAGALPVSIAVSVSVAASAPVATAVADFFEHEIGLDPASISLVSRAHVAAMHFDDMCLEVERGVEDHEFLC